MSLSLEVKKFINSEHTGEFVNVTLPSELPVRRERNAPHNPPKRLFRMHTGMSALPKKNCAKGKAAEVR